MRKLTKAQKLANCGPYPLTWKANISAIPDKLIKDCTAAQIALIADIVQKAYYKGFNEARDKYESENHA